ncbi:hypothetical protein D6833_09785 [Candidatus Parcubacteria bacterium]|nr:MAG: hypothetical protein D6833_09785 [Candidatus Parcubacteria bacterium]
MPPELQPHVPIRRAGQVARLSPAQQQVLAEAVGLGIRKRNMAAALRYLQQNPNASATDLAQAVLVGHETHTAVRSQTGVDTDTDTDDNASTIGMNADTPTDTDEARYEPLVSLILSCYPNMSESAARALAQSDALRALLSILNTVETAQESPHFRTDFVFVLFSVYISRLYRHLLQQSRDNLAYRTALQQAGISLPDIHDEKTDIEQPGGHK